MLRLVRGRECQSDGGLRNCAVSKSNWKSLLDLQESVFLSLTAMQCDPVCSNYNPCISKCPVETCDTYVENCVEDGCVEGCQLKKCPEGMVYSNDTFLECVPKEVCKPICKEIDGKKYYEGDVVKKDDCHTCRCTRNNVNCIGQPCAKVELITKTTPTVYRTTTPTPYLPPAFQEEDLKCKTGWSEWLNQDQELARNVKETKSKQKTKGLKEGDKEPLPSWFILVGVESKSRPFCSPVIKYPFSHFSAISMEDSVQRRKSQKWSAEL